MLILLALAVLAPVAAARSTSHPALRIADRQPLAVVGTGFRASERVRVTVVTSSRAVRTVVASRAGVFRVTFAAGEERDRCSGLFVRAVGARGSLAVAKLPQPMCLPQ